VTESTVLGQETTTTINPPIQRNNETYLNQIIDTRLLLNNKNRPTAKEFTDIIREYNTYGKRSINEVGAYIINRDECPYKVKRAYQNVVRATRTKMNFQIKSSDLTPAYTPAGSLASTDAPNYNINAVRMQSATKRKTVNVKIQIKKMNWSIDKNENGVKNEIFQVKKLSKNIDKNENGKFTTVIAAQGDTGANCSATDTIDIIHNYKEFAIPQDMGVFSGDESGTTLQALGEGTGQ
jgi:hypothetical protein